MPLKFKFRHPTPAIKPTMKNIDGYMRAAVLGVARRWVIETTDRVPVLTGASKASFLKLAFQAGVALHISPKAKNRIALGFGTSTGSIFYEKGKKYGFEWSSDLEYIHIVDRHNRFTHAGRAALKLNFIVLPQPTITYTNNQS